MASITLTEEEGAALLAAVDAQKTYRAEQMPDEQAALRQMVQAFIRLKELGWSEAIYCPKDGSMFSAIEAGSTGIHECNYVGKWPEGDWFVYDGDMWPSHPILWRERRPDDPHVNRGTAMEYDCTAREAEDGEERKDG